MEHNEQLPQWAQDLIETIQESKGPTIEQKIAAGLSDIPKEVYKDKPLPTSHDGIDAWCEEVRKAFNVSVDSLLDNLMPEYRDYKVETKSPEQKQIDDLLDRIM
ncbi:hypothetical protein [Pontibacter pamirensis]|uniref:hypothetical protein n=1 Tax=Pontibacter pamirensis TaxID=2562824 RepID=UPI001389D1DB|nr:hypothetical protein [Pontibacter pamirensis]